MSFLPQLDAAPDSAIDVSTVPLSTMSFSCSSAMPYIDQICGGVAGLLLFFFEDDGLGSTGEKHDDLANCCGSCLFARLPSKAASAPSSLRISAALLSCWARSFCDFSSLLRAALASTIFSFQVLLAAVALVAWGVNNFLLSSRPSTWRSGGARENSLGLA